MLSICPREAIASDAKMFMENIWMSSPNSTVLLSGITAKQLSKVCCNRWLSCDIIDSVFGMLNQSCTSHHFAVCSEAIIHLARAK